MTAPRKPHLLKQGIVAHDFTDEDRSRGGHARAAKLRAERHEAEARGEVKPRRRRHRGRWGSSRPSESEQRAIEASRQVAGAEPSAAAEDERVKALPANEQEAIRRGLTGPCWWEDEEELEARHERRTRDRFQEL